MSSKFTYADWHFIEVEGRNRFQKTHWTIKQFKAIVTIKTRGTLRRIIGKEMAEVSKTLDHLRWLARSEKQNLVCAIASQGAEG